MEMPIRIMITLFVAFVVGTTVIVFSKQMIDRSREDIERNRPGLGVGTEDEEKIIELTTVDDQQLIDLVTECYNQNHNKALERQLCFVVIGKSGSWSAAAIQAHFSGHPEFDAAVTVDAGLADGSYAMTIYFDPFGAKESILISK